MNSTSQINSGHRDSLEQSASSGKHPAILPSAGLNPAHTDFLQTLTRCRSLHFPSSDTEISRSIESKLALHRGILPIMSGEYHEGDIIHAREGFVINFADRHIRVRDPRALVVADDGTTSHERFSVRFGREFAADRSYHHEYLRNQDLIVTGFMLPGTDKLVALVAPRQTEIFAYIQAQIMGFRELDFKTLLEESPAAIIYLNPESRHTRYGSEQVVIHDRSRGIHEIYADSLYPGPSCKKGIFGVFLELAEIDFAAGKEPWSIAHAAIAVLEQGRSDKKMFFAHMGPSGSGKSENTTPSFKGKLHLATAPDGRCITIQVPHDVKVQPAMDDFGFMKLGTVDGRLRTILTDIECGYFLRTDSVLTAEDDPELQRVVRSAPETTGKPLVFLSYDVQPGESVSLFKHYENCSNPRVIVPKSAMPDFYDGPCAVDVMSFGIRAPRSVAHNPTYGVAGIVQVLDWKQYLMWCLVCPRGDKNPSTTTSVNGGLVTEGEGSMRPFNVGDKLAVANSLFSLLSRGSEDTRFFVFPNQNVGAYEVNWSQRLIRNVIAEEGFIQFNDDNLSAENHPFLGRTLNSFVAYGQTVPPELLNPALQPELGRQGFESGRKMLDAFFRETLSGYLDASSGGPKTGRNISLLPGLRDLINSAIRD